MALAHPAHPLPTLLLFIHIMNNVYEKMSITFLISSDTVWTQNQGSKRGFKCWKQVEGTTTIVGAFERA